ncbi:CDK5 regulatory subunit-associated protein 2 [Chanos chanos]|uniref:CDK5 regulatory subunit-associated protein 2 n=1 Tax=Chanos chanos TaxID=29144 RepID=A0A6J2US94_CHACN|nr:CDK5 regulatory subunit-associated protein 2 [Chanos chanos]
MDSVVGEDQTLPFDINGSLPRLTDSLPSEDLSMDNMTAPMFPGQKLSPHKAMTMKDYENQITALKKENFNLKLRIYFLEERMQQKCDDSTEDIYKTNIELKVEVESMKRDLAEKQELLVSASKALESLAGRDSGDGVRERAQREMNALRDTLNMRIRELEQALHFAEEEVEKMASIAEQEKLKNIGLEKQLEAAGQSGNPGVPGVTPGPIQDLQKALQEKESIIQQLHVSLQDRDSLIGQLQKNSDQPMTEQISQLSALIGQKDGEVQALREELDRERARAEKDTQVCMEHQTELSRLEALTRQLTEELKTNKSSNQSLSAKLEEANSHNKALSVQLEEKDSELATEKRNALKRDKTIQGLGVLLKEKEKEIEDLYKDMEDRDQALAKAREAVHKAQIQKYQGAEEQQSLLMEKQEELSKLQAEAHSSLLEAQRLQRSLGSKDIELGLLQQAKDQLEQELEELQQQKKKGDKTINDLQNQLKKLNGEFAERENAREQQHQEQLEQIRSAEHKLQSTIQRLTASLNHKDQQLQEYMNMIRDLELSRSPAGSDVMVAKLRERLKETEKALERALDEKFAAVEEKDNELHLLQLSLREKERDLERLNNLLAHNQETISSFDALIKERDVELQQLLNSLKNAQRCKDQTEENLNRALREKDAIIQQLTHSLESKTKEIEELRNTVLTKSDSDGLELAGQMCERLKVVEVMLSEAVKERERLVVDNQSAVDNLLATINSKDQLIKESAERHSRSLSEHAAELQDLRRQLIDAQQQLSNAQKQNATAEQDGCLEMAELRAALAEKDTIINKLLERGQERDRFLTEVKGTETPPGQVLELRQTIQLLQEQLEEREAELSRRNSEEDIERPAMKKSSVVLLKKELAEKTDAFNKALKRENQLKMSLSELQSAVRELEGKLEAQTANIESLTSTLNTKEEIINELQRCLSQRGESCLTAGRDQASVVGEDRSLPTLPQRERTLIGGDSQQEATVGSVDIRVEQAELNRALRVEQQLYSNLIRAVKEKDSAERLQALQLELTAVTLLRQQLEAGIRDNEKLREQLEREIQRAGQRKDSDPAELESMRDALEEAQRWNASLQARLGQIQSRGGGVGQANDSADTLSLIGEQTSYLSFCVREGHEEEPEDLSVQQLKVKISELQTENAELRGKLREMESEIRRGSDLSDLKSHGKKPQGHDLPGSNTERLNSAVTQEDEETVGVSASSSQTQTGPGDSSHPPQRATHDRERAELRSLLEDCGAESVSQLREQVARLRSEASQMRGFLKEENSTESKESAESSGDSEDQNYDLHQTVSRLRTEAKGHRKVIRLLKEQLQRRSATDGEVTGFDPELIVSMAREMERLRAENDAAQRHAHALQDRLQEREERKQKKEQGSKLNKNQKHQMARHAAYVKSRLPVPVRSRKPSDKSVESNQDSEMEAEVHTGTHMEQAYPGRRHPGEAFTEIVTENQAIPGGSQNQSPEISQNKGMGLSTAKQSPDTEVRWNSDRCSEVGDAELLAQLELLHQECQQNEELIARLQLQAQERDELQAELQEKDKLNRQYLEALEAAESTIAYLTACSLDSESRLGQAEDGVLLMQRCTELQKQLQEKERVNAQLLECLNTAESAIASLSIADPPFSQPGQFNQSHGQSDHTSAQFEHAADQAEPQELCERLERLLQQIKNFQEHQEASETLRGPHSTEGGPEVRSDAEAQTNILQAALWDQSRLNAELQEKLRAAEATISQMSTKANYSDPTHSGPEDKGNHETLKRQELLIQCLSECVQSTESAVESLTNLCSNYEHPGQCPADCSPRVELQQQLDRLHRALQERNLFVEPGRTEAAQISAAGSQPHGTARSNTATQRNTARQGKHQQTRENSKSEPQKSAGTMSSQNISLNSEHQHRDLYKNLLVLLQIITERAQKVQELEKRLQGDMRHGQVDNGEVRAEEVWLEKEAQLESLQKALREKQKTCRSLQEKLTTAQSIIALQNSAKTDKHSKAPLGDQDEKGVQVDLQDLGYETSGRSETEVEREEGGSTDVDGTVQQDAAVFPVLKPSLPGFSSVENLDTSASSPSYPSSPGLSLNGELPRPHELNNLTSEPALLQQQLVQLRAQVEGQQKIIQHLQGQIRKASLSLTPDPAVEQGGEGDRDKMMKLKAQISELSVELEREKSLNRSNQSPSPSRIESLVQSQARELCELREQIRVSRGLGVEQRRQLLELRGALEELLQPGLDSQLKDQLDRSLGLLDKLEQGDAHMDSEMGAEQELTQSESDWMLHELQYLRSQVEGDREQQQLQIMYLCRQNQSLALATKDHLDILSVQLQEKDNLIQSLKDQLHSCQTLSNHQASDSEMTDRLSNDGTTSFHNSPSGQHRTNCSSGHMGLMVTNGVAAGDPGGVSSEVGVSETGERRVWRLQMENGRLQEQLRNSEELNATLRSELDLTRSILTHTQSSPTQQAQTQNQTNKTISSDLLAEHLLEIRALRQRLEETIRTNERLREQLERKLQQAERDTAATNIFIAGAEEQGQLTNEIRFLLAQNHTLKEQLNQGARDKQKENDRLRETLARRTAKLELSRKECDALRQEHTNLQDNLQYSREQIHRLQREVKMQRQQLADTQQLVQSLRVELQVHEHIRSSAQTHTEGGQEKSGVSADSVDLSELLAEIRRLRLQLERSIQINTALRERLEQLDPKSTININYLLPHTDDSGRSEIMHIHTERSSASHDSGSSVGSGSPAPSRLVPGHRLWADRQGRHVLGLIEDYSALRKQITEAHTLTSHMDTQLQQASTVLEQAQSKAFSGSVNRMLQVLEEATRLLNLFWRVTLPSGDCNYTEQEELLRGEISRLKNRLSQQERMLTGAVKRLRSTNKLKEGMERVIINQLSLTHGVLRKARGNLETNSLNIIGLKGLEEAG